MKRLFALPLLLGLLSSPLFAIDTVFLEPVVPTSPELKAQGGSSTANARGFASLFANPAAFSDSKTEVTLFSLQTNLHLSLSGLNKILDGRSMWNNLLSFDEGSLLWNVDSLVKTSTVGLEVSSGVAWVGNNLGVGLVLQGRESMRGKSLLDTKSRIDVTAMGVIGMGWPFDVGLGTLRLGGAIRPMQRMLAEVPATDLLMNLGNYGSFEASSGFGLGLDLGLRWDYAGFQTGLVVRDASGTVFNMRRYTLAQWQSGFGFPSGGGDTGKTIYRIPTVLGFGTAWTPDMGSLGALFQPSLSFDLQVPFKDEFTQPSFWTWTHVGAEAKLLRSFSLRAGVNQGYATFGLGVRVLIFDFNLAIFSDELGRYSGLNRRPGISTELAFKL